MSLKRLEFVIDHAFTNETFGGNSFAVFFAAEQLSGKQMQQIARGMNCSEPTFVLPLSDFINIAIIRVFTLVNELLFAGHLNAGTGYVLVNTSAAAPLAKMRVYSRSNIVFVAMCSS